MSWRAGISVAQADDLGDNYIAPYFRARPRDFPNPSRNCDRQVGATLGATRANYLSLSPDRHEQRARTKPRSRTDLNGSG